MHLLSKSWSEVAFFDSNVFRVGVLCSVCFSGLHGSRIHSNFIGFRYVFWVLVLFVTQSLSTSFGNATETQDTCLLNSLPKILAWWLHTCVYLLPGSGSFWWRWWTDCLWLTIMRLWVHLLPSKLSRFLCNPIHMIDWVSSSMCYKGAFLAFSLYQMWLKDSAMC
jgi:hypothetical protein